MYKIQNTPLNIKVGLLYCADSISSYNTSPDVAECQNRNIVYVKWKSDNQWTDLLQLMLKRFSKWQNDCMKLQVISHLFKQLCFRVKYSELE